MTPFLSYLLKANLVLVLLYGFYLLCFRRDTFYGHIRWYLLATIVSAIAFPLVNISGWLAGSPAVVEVSQYVPDINVVYQYVLAQPQTEFTVAVEPAPVAHTIPFALIIWWCWLSVTILLSGKRLFQLACIACLWWRYPRQRHGNRSIIAVDRGIQPFSFAGRIFLNPSLYPENELNEIVTHEQVHCRQGHTIDILLTEALVCLCWFNPVAWRLRRDLKQNLEYDTDRRTLQSGFDRKHYQYSLLRFSGNTYQIVNHFHYHHLKKRIIMMNKKESPRILTAKYMLVVPALAAALLTVQISGLQASEKVDIVGDQPSQADAAILPASDNPAVVTVENPAAGVIKDVLSPVPDVLVQVPDSQALLTPSQNYRIYKKTSSNPPFIILDGIELPNVELKNMNPATIESITVLKDGTAIDLYGGKAKDGVVIITTKKGVKSMTPQEPSKTGTIPDYRTRQGTGNVTQTETDAQAIQISGTVSHAGRSPLPGVAVIVKGTNKGIVTDMNGKYSLDAPANAILQFSFVDMSSREIAVENRQVIDVVMNTNIQSFDKKSVEKIKQITNSDSLLFIVDGEKVSSIENISPQSIESISILKDQAAVSIYGEKAKNGVIIIHTKK